MNKISVIVPCYNEEESLPLFYNETSKVLMSIEGTDYEILFVDDGSSDRTLKMIKDLCGRDSRVRYVAFSRNFGKEAGMYAGLKESRGDFCVIMDADLQHPPALPCPSSNLRSSHILLNLRLCTCQAKGPEDAEDLRPL